MLTVDYVTAISVTHNSKHCIDALAKSLAAFNHIIIVDNGSSDGCPEKIADVLPQAHLIQSERNLGFGAANNRALDLVQTPYALLLNPDCIVAPSEIGHLLKVATAYPEAAMIAPQLVRSGGLYEINPLICGKSFCKI